MGFLEGFYRVVMRRTSVYVTFVVVGTFFGERAVDYGVKKLWEHNNIRGSSFVKLMLTSLLTTLTSLTG